MAISTADPRLTEAIACIDAFYARMFRDWPVAINQHHDAYALSYSGDNRLTGANHLMPRADDGLTYDILTHSLKFFDKFGAAWSVIYTDSHLPEAENFLRAHDFHIRWRSPLMVLDRPLDPVPSRLIDRAFRVQEPKHLCAVRQVMGEAFATRRSVNERVARIAHLDDPHIDHYLIMEGEEPVVCATVVNQDGMAGVWNVGTRRAWRRQGYATAIMHALLADQAARGYAASMLMASAAGKPLYEQLGYRQIGFTYYAGPPYHIMREA